MAIVGVVILAVVAALALTAAQTAPPAIAELSPSAVQQIKDAPTEQTSTAGEGDGGGGGGEGATTTTTAATLPDGTPAVPTTLPPTIERARIRRCVGNPPRQTEDPQSPPCVAFWQGDNGGATYKGVTADTITLTIPWGGERVAQDLQAYFNKRYEFYGRHLELVNWGFGQNCEDRKAAAVSADTYVHAFGTLDATDGNAGACFTAEMARRGLMSSSNSVTFSDTEMAKLAPYLWQYDMGFDKIVALAGEQYCARLHGANATRAPDPLLARSPRKLGVVLQNSLRDTPLDIAPLERALARCGAKVARYERLSTNDDTGLVSPQNAELAMAGFKSDGVTTVLNLGIAFVSQYISGAASKQQYYPEWIFTTYGGFDSTLVVHSFWPDVQQRQSIIGFSIGSPLRPITHEPAYSAAKEVDSALDPTADFTTLSDFTSQYRALLVMASGIQLAGPNLTPETFAAGMKRSRFPYPAVDPLHSGDVGFTDGDHSMTDDAVEFWWSETAKGPLGYGGDGASGTFCYLDDKARQHAAGGPPAPGPSSASPATRAPDRPGHEPTRT
jgi:hypothetical protein